MIRLYNFQENIIARIKIAMLDGHRRIMVQSPTGSGKTVIFSAIIYGATVKGNKTLILTDRVELLTGSEGTLAKFGIETTNILSGQKWPPSEYQNCIAMSQTLRRRLSSQTWREFISSFDMIIIDEAHIQEFNVYFEKEAVTNIPYILAFTATPKRSKKQRSLSEDYSILIDGPQVQELITLGFLVEDRYYAPKHFDVSDIKLNSFGDYKESDMFKKFENTISYNSVVDNWRRLANDSITLVFCVNIEHTLKMCRAFNDNGITAKFIVSPVAKPQFNESMTDEQFVRYQQRKKLYELYQDHMAKYSGNRQDIIKDWENGDFKILVNSGIYTKGYDHKPLETVIILRATTSESLWLQMIGRGSRIFKEKTYFNILDFGSNAEKLGLYKQDRVWSLVGDYSSSEGVAPVKECGLISGVQKKDKNNRDGCGSLVLASRKICNYCGYIFEREKIEIDVNLIEIEYGYAPKSRYKDIDFERLERQSEERGYKSGWIINQIIARGGLSAVKAFQDYKNYKASWIWRIEKTYSQAIKKYEEKMLEKELQNEIESKGFMF